MTKRQTRLFFFAGTLLFALIFIGLTIDSHRQFGALTHADQITPEVIAGKHVWHQKDCINCHTLLGEGATIGRVSFEDMRVAAAERAVGI